MTSTRFWAASELTVSVLQAMADGLSDAQIAAHAHVSTRTVQRLIDNFKTATGASTRFAAGAAACRLGLLDQQSDDSDHQ